MGKERDRWRGSEKERDIYIERENGQKRDRKRMRERKGNEKEREGGGRVLPIVVQEADNLTQRRVGTLEPQQKGQSSQFVQRLGSERKKCVCACVCACLRERE